MKIARANQHLNELIHEFDVFLKPYTKQSVINHSFDGTWHILCANPIIQESIPLLFSIICGDAVHNLRSALDHLVWQLVLTEGGRPDRWNTFPIYTDPQDFDRFVRLPKKPERASLHGIAREGGIWKLIEEEQPYNSGEPSEHYLTILARLSNIDKHRTLQTRAIYPSPDSIRDAVKWNPAAHLLERKATLNPIPSEGEAEVLRLRFSETGPEPQVYVEGTIKLQPTFGDGETFQYSIGSIKQMPTWMADFVEKFTNYF